MDIIIFASVAQTPPSDFKMADLSQSKVAIVLSGCGDLDGSNVHEVSAACSAITKMKDEVVLFCTKKIIWQNSLRKDSASMSSTLHSGWCTRSA